MGPHRTILDSMSKTMFLCLTLSAALEAQPHLPKRGAPASPSTEHKPSGANLSPTQQRNTAVSDAQSLLKASGVSSADAALIAADLQAIGVEVQKTAQTAQPGELRKKLGRK